MAEFKFSCPHCQQSIKCDELWSGQQLQCPSCQVALTVPSAPAAAPGAPPPPSAGPMRLNIARHAPAPAPEAAPAPVSTPTAGTSFQSASQGTSFQRRTAPAKVSKKSAAIKKYATIAASLIVAGVACYFGYAFFHQWQLKANEKAAAAAKNSDGGEMGHIANVYSVLDATDPARREAANQPGAIRRARNAARMNPAAGGGAEMADAGAMDNASVSPAVWTLDVNAATIPDGPANGMVSGANFVASAAKVERVGQAEVLRLQQQGMGGAVDREVMVYLHLGPGETLAGHSWTASKDEKPRKSRRW